MSLYYYCYCIITYFGVCTENASILQLFTQNSMENIFQVENNCCHSQQCCQLKRLVDLYCGQALFEADAYSITISHMSLITVNIRWFLASEISEHFSKIFSCWNLNWMYIYWIYINTTMVDIIYTYIEKYKWLGFLGFFFVCFFKVADNLKPGSDFSGILAQWTCPNKTWSYPPSPNWTL